MLFKRILVILCPILIIIGYELLFYFTQNVQAIILILAVLFLILLFSLKSLIKEKFLSGNFWGLAILPLLFYLTASNFILILGFGWLRQIVLIFVALALVAYLESIFLFYFQRAHYRVNSLENASTLLSMLIFTLLVLDIDAMNILLNPPLWILSIILLACLGLLLWQLFWILKIANKFKNLYILIYCLILLEFFWALSFLPSNFYILSIILAILYYFMIGVLKARLQAVLDKKVFLRYIIISGILLLLIIFTSRWI